MDLHNEGLRLPESYVADCGLLPAWYVAQTLFKLGYGATIPRWIITRSPLLGNQMAKGARETINRAVKPSDLDLPCLQDLRGELLATLQYLLGKCLIFFWCSRAGD